MLPEHEHIGSSFLFLLLVHLNKFPSTFMCLVLFLSFLLLVQLNKFPSTFMYLVLFVSSLWTPCLGLA